MDRRNKMLKEGCKDVQEKQYKADEFGKKTKQPVGRSADLYVCNGLV